jgi:hypothetical protein
VTPCAQRNKEFFTRGVFYLLDCCTNVVVRNRRLEAGGQTGYRLLATDNCLLNRELRTDNWELLFNRRGTGIGLASGRKRGV